MGFWSAPFLHHQGGGFTTTGDLPLFNIDKSTRNSSRGGQFWRRLVAIWPNYRNAPVRLKRGFATSTFTKYDLETIWRGKLENVAFESQGQVTIRCADLYGGEAAGLERKIPNVSTSSNGVIADASRSATSVDVVDGTLYTQPTVATLHVRNGGEIIQVTGIASNTLTLSRGKFGTIAEPIFKGDTLTECVPYMTSNGACGLHPVDIWLDLLDRAGLDTDEIDSAQMRGAGGMLNGLRFQRLVTEPTPIKTLINELCELTMSALYVGEGLKVRLSTPHPPVPGSSHGAQSGLATITDNPHVIDPPGVKCYTNENERLTHCAIFYGKRGDSSSGGDDWNNIALAINGTTFSDGYYGSTEADRKEKKIETEWLPSHFQPASYTEAGVNSGFANVLTTRWVNRHGTAPVVFELETEMRNRAWRVGDCIQVETCDWQTVDGFVKTELCRIIKRVDDNQGRIKLTLHALNYDAIDAATGRVTRSRYAFIAPDHVATTYASATTGDREYAYIGDASNLVNSGATAGYLLC